MRELRSGAALLQQKNTTPAAISDLVEAALDNAAITLNLRQRQAFKAALIDTIAAHHLAIVDRGTR